MMQYIIQTFIFQLLFLLMYEWLFKKEVLFTYNRVYLLATTVLSLVLPFIYFSEIQTVIPENYLEVLPEILIPNSIQKNQTNTLVFSYLYIIWGIGFLISLGLLIYKFHQLKKIKQSGKQEKLDDIYLVTLPETDIAFSFLRTIFLGENLSEKKKQTLFLHEKVHINQKHSLDLLFFEIIRIAFWFNPLMYVFQKKITLLHEYIADAKVSLKQNKKQYYQDLLSETFSTTKISFINTFFNHSFIKKRIIMLQKTNSKVRNSKISKSKYLLVLPIILGMLIYTSCIQKPDKSSNFIGILENDNQQNTENDKDEIPFATIDKVPTYPDCLGANQELKKCMSQQISKFVNTNFNIKLANSLNLKGKQRISVLFKINKLGNIVDVKAKANHPELEAEAKRVVSLLPKMKPGEHQGKQVGVLYTLPIIFEISE